MRPQPLSNDFIIAVVPAAAASQRYAQHTGDNDDFLMITIIIIVTNVKCRHLHRLKHRLLINLNNLVGKT